MDASPRGAVDREDVEEAFHDDDLVPLGTDVRRDEASAVIFHAGAWLRLLDRRQG